MIQFFRHNKIISLLLLVNYVLIGIICGLLHTHEGDLVFHDNCPACQWEIQSQDTDTSLSDVCHTLQIQSTTCIKYITNLDVISQSETFSENQPSRAPPFSS